MLHALKLSLFSIRALLFVVSRNCNLEDIWEKNSLRVKIAIGNDLKYFSKKGLACCVQQKKETNCKRHGKNCFGDGFNFSATEVNISMNCSIHET